MFTGIIETQGRVVALQPQHGGMRVTVTAPRLARALRPGASVAVNGACVSVVTVRPPRLAFDIIAETLRCTNLGRLVVGSRLNLERSLKAGQRVDGHFVLGHVDGTGRVVACHEGRDECWMDIEVREALTDHLVPKGSVAVDGVSLTLGPCRGRRFRVFLIPQTLRRTTLGERQRGELVNVETDILLKLASHLRQRRR